MSGWFTRTHLGSGRQQWLILLHDVVICVLAFAIALVLRAGQDWDADNWRALGAGGAIVAICAAAVFWTMGVHRHVWRYSATGDQLSVLRAATITVILAILAMFMLARLEGVPRSVPVIHWFVLVVLLSGSRFAYRVMTRSPAADGSPNGTGGAAPVLLLGAGEGAAICLHALDAVPRPPWRAVGLLDDEGHLRGRAVHGVPVLGRVDDLEGILSDLANHGIQPERLVVTKPVESLRPGLLAQVAQVARAHGMELDELPSLIAHGRGFATSEPVAAEAELVPEAARWVELKRGIDVLVASALLIVTAPVALVVALLVLIDLGSPVLFPQVRPGWKLRPFTLLKFRSMRGARAADGRILDDAERASRIGRFIRRTRLDEIPQLLNVLKGDMSFIGPRPLLQRDLADFPDGGVERAQLRPGLTGWAQVNGGQSLNPREKMALDLWYIRHCGPWLDLKIALRTIRTVVLGEQIDHAAIAEALRYVESRSMLPRTPARTAA